MTKGLNKYSVSVLVGHILLVGNLPDTTKISPHRQMSAQSLQRGLVLLGCPALKMVTRKRLRDLSLKDQHLSATSLLSTPSSLWIWSYALPAVFFVVFSSPPSWAEGCPPLISSHHPLPTDPVLPSTRFHSSLILF